MKNEKKKISVQNLKWATAHLSRRLGARLGARNSDTARRRGARHAGTAQAAWACGPGASGRWGAGRWALGRRARGALRQRAAGAGRHGVGAQGRAAGRTVRAGHGLPGRGLGAGWVRRLGQFWCTVHLVKFWLGFWTRFDSVFS